MMTIKLVLLLFDYIFIPHHILKWLLFVFNICCVVISSLITLIEIIRRFDYLCYCHASDYTNNFNLNLVSVPFSNFSNR